MTSSTTVTKAEIAENLSNSLGINKQISKELVDQTFEEIRQNVERGRSMRISGFGNFELRDKKARPGRNPKTGVPKLISARRVLTFKAGQKLKAKLQEIENLQK